MLESTALPPTPADSWHDLSSQTNGTELVADRDLAPTSFALQNVLAFTFGSCLEHTLNFEGACIWPDRFKLDFVHAPDFQRYGGRRSSKDGLIRDVSSMRTDKHLWGVSVPVASALPEVSQ